MTKTRKLAPRRTAIGRRLTAIRQRLELSQEAAARLVKCTARAWIGWELGQYRPSQRSLKLIELLEAGKLK